MSTVILVAGKVLPQYIDALIEQLKPVEHKIASLWDDEDPVYVKRLIDNNFLVTTSDHNVKPGEIHQSIPIARGVQFANELGHACILRTRFDILCSNWTQYMRVAKPMYDERLTAICGIGNYFLDWVVAGRTEDMCRTYTIMHSNPPTHIELFLMDNYVGKRISSQDEIRAALHFTVNLCRQHGIEFTLFRKPDWAAPNRTIPNMRVINEYCTEPHAWS